MWSRLYKRYTVAALLFGDTGTEVVPAQSTFMTELIAKSSPDPEALLSDRSEQPPSTTVDIRQKHFGFAQSDTDKTALETQDVLTCMGLVAVHRARGLAFMMHLDVPWYCNSVVAALTELRDRCGVDCLDEVELYDVAGITPKMSLISSAFLAIMCYCIHPWGSLAALVIFVIFIATRSRTRWQLKKLGFKRPQMLVRKQVDDEPRTWWDFRVNIYISTIGKGAFVPVLTLPKHKDRDPRFLALPLVPENVPRLVGWYLRTRAELGRRYMRADGSK